MIFLSNKCYSVNWRKDPHNCWTISAIFSDVHLKNFMCLQQDSNPSPLWWWCSWRSYQLSYEATQLWADQLVRLMCSHERNDEWKKCLWSVVERWIEEIIITLAVEFQRLSHTCTGKFQVSREHMSPSNWPASVRIINYSLIH